MTCILKSLDFCAGIAGGRVEVKACAWMFSDKSAHLCHSPQSCLNAGLSDNAGCPTIRPPGNSLRSLISFLFLLFMATPMAHGSSRARGQIRAAPAGLHHSHSNVRFMSAACTTVHGNTGSLTHRVRPGIKPASSWILVRFLTCLSYNVNFKKINLR